MGRFGWIPDTPDFRDFGYKAAHKEEQKWFLPKSVNLQELCPPVWNQGDLGSCTGQATAAGFYMAAKKQNKAFDPSRMFIYYNARRLESTTKVDAGATIRNAIKSIVKWGETSEAYWPYTIKNYRTQPSTKAYKNAASYQVMEYSRLNNAKSGELMSCLAAGYPFVFGMALYESFERSSGVVSMPRKGEKMIGGHAMLCVGYDGDRFLVRNSWGASWSLKGYCYIPFSYITSTKYADDFWTIRTLEK